MEKHPISVSDAIALINQTLEYAYPTIVVEGEVASFRVNQNKYVFFDLKDDSGTLGCFMMVYALRRPIEDGMRVRVVAQPRLTPWGKFSLTVREIQPVGEGNLRRSFELLLAKLTKDGLFDDARKRPLPPLPQRIGVISSLHAAGYTDFVKIINERWGGVELIVASTAVQGASAPPQIVRALEYFNHMAEPPDVVVILRGGGSQDDLSAFNDEPLVRAIAASRVPVITGIGHEVDTSLADLAADVRASTPSNAAQLLVPHRRDTIARVERDRKDIGQSLERRSRQLRQQLNDALTRSYERIQHRQQRLMTYVTERSILLRQLDPRAALRRGYSLLRNEKGSIITEAAVGDEVKIETQTSILTAGVHYVQNKST